MLTLSNIMNIARLEREMAQLRQAAPRASTEETGCNDGAQDKNETPVIISCKTERDPLTGERYFVD